MWKNEIFNAHKMVEFMIDRVRSVVKNYQTDGMFDTAEIFSAKSANYWWVLRKNGTFLWDMEEISHEEIMERLEKNGWDGHYQLFTIRADTGFHGPEFVVNLVSENLEI